MIPVRTTDVLVIGAGAAGLEAALTAAGMGRKVLVVSKGAAASPSILGFCAPVGPGDSPERYAQDTLRGGWDLGEPELARTLAGNSADTVRQLAELGCEMDRDASGYRLLQPLGCSVPRLVKRGNETGKESLRVLRAALLSAGAEILENTMALELLRDGDAVCGAVCMGTDGREAFLVHAGAVALCCGGAHMMRGSTYPLCQTADGMAMACRAGAALIDLEFLQHEPCRAVWPRPLGLSTTLLARGGILTNRLGDRFVLKHYPTEGAAPKDMLARLVALEILEGRGTEHGGVYLDLTGIPREEIVEKHAMYHRRFLDAGIDLTRERAEVGPAAHSMMGGVEIVADCGTGIPGLFAAGEVTGGLHGANRLGGNAGAEVYVFGRIAGESAAAAAARSAALPREAVLQAEEVLRTDPGAAEEDWEAVIAGIRNVTARAMGPVRDGNSLRGAAGELEKVRERIGKTAARSLPEVKARTEAAHLALIGLLSCRAALEREESRGVHFRRDYPDMSPGWRRHIRFAGNGE